MSIETVYNYLPDRLVEEIMKYKAEVICEIRLYADRNAMLTTAVSNVPLKTVCSKHELAEIIDRMCGGSFHAYGETIKNGYIPLEKGCRVGVCGRYSENGIRDIGSLCIRIPRNIKGTGLSLCKKLLSSSGGGMLIFSPPGEGKTTLLRDMASTLSSLPYNKRVSVIDSRGEIYRDDAFAKSAADIYIGYPKAYGIELATRTMSPQYIICDELGAEEAKSVIEAQNCGVPLIASAHALTLEGLLRRKAMKELDSARVFEFYVGIRRMGNGFSFEIIRREDN